MILNLNIKRRSFLMKMKYISLKSRRSRCFFRRFIIVLLKSIAFRRNTSCLFTLVVLCIVSTIAKIITTNTNKIRFKAGLDKTESIMVRRPSLKWNSHASYCSSMKVRLVTTTSTIVRISFSFDSRKHSTKVTYGISNIFWNFFRFA